MAFFSEEDKDVAGYFSAEVTGDAEWSFEGFAFFGETTHEDTGQDVFVVFLTDMQGEAAFAFTKGGDRPDSGTMNIGDFSYSATGVLATQPGNELEINVEGGFNAIPGDVDIP